MRSLIKNWRFLGLLLMVGVVLLLAGNQLLASTNDDYVETAGVIEAIGPDSLVVNGLTFWVDANTRVYGKHHRSLNFADLNAGDFVEVHAQVQADGSFLATRIQRKEMDEGEPGKLHTKGFIEAIGSDSLVVNGVTFWVNDQTRVRGEHDSWMQFSDLKAGDYVEIEAQRQMDGSYLALEIHLENQMRGFEVKGNIEAIGTDSLVVNGMTFWVDSLTQVLDKEDQPISFSDLQVNDFVEVRAQRLPDGSLYAYKIKKEEASSHFDEMEMKGLIQELGADYLVVNGLTIQVNASTRIEDEEGNPLSFSDLALNMYVEVKVQVQADGSYLALKIKLEESHNIYSKVEVRGTIDSLWTDNAGNNYLRVLGYDFLVDAATEIRGPHHQMFSYSDLALGMLVEVKGYQQSNGSYRAAEIHVEESNRYELEISSAIDTIYDQTVVVSGIPFQTDSATIIVDAFHNPMNFADLQIGMRVEVKGYRLSDGSYYAFKIKVEEFWQSVFEFEAQIDSVGANWILLMGQTIYVTDSTQILDENKMPVNFSYLQKGQWVHVRAWLSDTGQLIALKIRVKTKRPFDFETHATIDTIYANGLRAGGIDFLVDQNTEIYDHFDQPITLADLQIGMFVEIKAVQQTDGSYLATRIKVEGNPNFSYMNGALSGRAADMIIVGNASVQLTSQTVFLDEQFNVITLDQLPLGAQVNVWADYSTPTQPQAIQVQLSAPSSVTVIDNPLNPGVPKAYALEQNYPNPFNPTTVIPFTIAGNQWSRVRLEVFNILGQKVRTLFDGVVQGGHYTFTWDGRDQNGQLLPSGIYFYRLIVNEKPVQTRRMVFMK